MDAIKGIGYRLSWLVILVVLIVPLTLLVLIGALVEGVIQSVKLAALFKLLWAPRADLAKAEDVVRLGLMNRVPFPQHARNLREEL